MYGYVTTKRLQHLLFFFVTYLENKCFRRLCQGAERLPPSSPALNNHRWHFINLRIRMRPIISLSSGAASCSHITLHRVLVLGNVDRDRYASYSIILSPRQPHRMKWNFPLQDDTPSSHSIAAARKDDICRGCLLDCSPRAFDHG